MIHPHTQLKKVNDIIGYGVFATRKIPAGTVVYAKDALEIQLSPSKYMALDPQTKRIADWYSYIDQRGFRIISWDIAKYMNHCCEPNTISTGYGFEIAVRDIMRNEEITDEYGLFNMTDEMPCHCKSKHCRKSVNGKDFDKYYAQWDSIASKALAKFRDVDQPLQEIIDAKTMFCLNQYLAGKREYASVLSLKFGQKSTLASAQTAMA